jgi:hypothetical protein
MLSNSKLLNLGEAVGLYSQIGSLVIISCLSNGQLLKIYYASA